MKKTGKLFFILLGAGLSFGAAAESWNMPVPSAYLTASTLVRFVSTRRERIADMMYGRISYGSACLRI